MGFGEAVNFWFAREMVKLAGALALVAAILILIAGAYVADKVTGWVNARRGR